MTPAQQARLAALEEAAKVADAEADRFYRIAEMLGDERADYWRHSGATGRLIAKEIRALAAKETET